MSLQLLFQDQRAASLFSDYLATKGIVSQVIEHDSGYLLHIEVEDEAQLQWIQNERIDFSRHPYHQKYRAAAWHHGQPLKPSSRNQQRLNLRQFLRQSHHSLGWVTSTMLAFCLVSYLLLLFWGELQVLDWFGYPINGQFHGEYWRFITPIFIHFSLFHLLGNMMWLLYLGRWVESAQGSGRLLWIVLLSGVIANQAQFLFTHNANFGGFSGVAFALVGYVWLWGIITQSRQPVLPNAIFIFSLLWIAAGYLEIIPNVANTAHSVGLLVGLSMALIYYLIAKFQSSGSV